MIRPTGTSPRRSLPAAHFRIALVIVIAAGSGCAPRLAPLPGGLGTPFADYAEAYAEATARCRGVRTYVGVLDLSGRAGEERIRGRVEAGFAAPGLIRLEGRPPALAFGRAIFVLVGRASDATLILPRDRRVLTDAPTDAIIETLAGVALTADELRAIVSGCGLGLVEDPSGARAYEDGLVAVNGAETTTWLRNAEGTWRPFATVRGPLEIRYEEFNGAYPTRIRIRTAPADFGAHADLTVRTSDVDINTDLDPEVFREPVPDDCIPITLDELRRARIQGEERQP